MASTGGYIQGALEEAPNAEGGANAVSSVLVYQPGTSIDMDPKVSVLERKDELRGGFFAMPHSGAAAYDPDGTLEGRVYPGAIGQLLCCAVGIDTPSVVAATKVHTYSWKTSEIPQTMQLLFAPPDGNTFWKATGVGIDELAFKVADNAWQFTAKLMGLKCATLADPVVTPSYETVGPWRAGQMVLSWLSGSAVTEDFDWSIKNGLKQERSFAHSSLYPDQLVYEQALPVIGGTIAKRSLDSDDWAELTGGTPFAASITMTHSTMIGATAIPYSLTVTMPACQYVTAKADAIKNERRNKASFDWEARWDTATSAFCTIVLVNDTATYETYA